MARKKRSTKQEDTLRKKGKVRRKQDVSSSTAREKKVSGIVPPSSENQKVLSAIKKMSVITPYTIAVRFDLLLSTAKGFLRELEHRGVIECVSQSRNLRIYKPSN